MTSQVLGRETVTPYDSLLVAAGAGQSWFGNDQFARHAPGMKSIDDALELRGRIFGAFELAELAADAGRGERALTFVVVGAGPTGRRDGRPDRRAGQPHAARTTSAGSTPPRPGSSSSTRSTPCCPSFGERLGGAARRRLTDMGVDVRLGTKVTDVDATGITVTEPDGSSTRIEALTKVWAAGVQASPLGRQIAEQSGAGVDRAGRVQVLPDLTVPGHPEVFVVGDMMALDRLPGVAQVAIQGARFAARQITRRLDGKEPEPRFEYFDKGSMATISRFSAVASIGRLRFSGFFAWVLWLAIHLVYIIGFKHRVTTLLHWAVSFLGRGRSERVATEQQVFGRQAIDGRAHGELPVHPHRPGRRRGQRRGRARGPSPRDRLSGVGHLARRVTAMPLDYPIHRRDAPQRDAGRRQPRPHGPQRHGQHLGRRRLAPRDGRAAPGSRTSSST